MKKLDKIQKLIWENSSSINLPDPPDKDKMWSRLEQLMDITKIDSQKSTSINIKQMGIWSAIKRQLSFAVPLSILFIISLPIAYNILTTEIHSTSKSECRSISLVDGSKVELNCESRIKYNKNFNDDHRTIYLSGEAYFDIQKGKYPFIINTDFGQITVLGTKFNLRTRHDGFELGVNEGAVTIFQNDDKTILEKGQLFQINHKNKKNKKNMIYQNYPGWLNDKLVCDKTRLIEICGEIERKFDISFIFKNTKLKEFLVSGVIDTKNLESVLSTISLLTQHEFKFNGETCTII